MDAMRKEELLELGQTYVRQENLKTALKSLHHALVQYIGPESSLGKIDRQTLERLPSELLSYYGLCIALVENRVEEGIRLCQMALAKDILHADFYLNLGKVYLKAAQKTKALETFRMGLAITEKNKELRQALEKFGTRRKPILGSLPRHHFLNRYLGLLLHQLDKDRSRKAR